MIEILFGESEAASMKAAKCTVLHGKIQGATSVWCVGKKKPAPPPFQGWIEGTSDEVICLGFLLDIGSISKPFDSPYRRNLIYSIYAQNQWEQDVEMEAALKASGDNYVKKLQRLKEFLENGEPVRIWYSDAPYSRCGFYHICSFLQKYENEIHTVKLPEYIVSGKQITSYINWGEVSAEQFSLFLPYEKVLSLPELRMYASLWSELVHADTPLRAVINGTVHSVHEDFYDYQIFDFLTHEPTKQARLIGNLLGHLRSGIGDWWYAKRIEHYIEQGKIKVVEDSPNKYARTIRLA